MRGEKKKGGGFDSIFIGSQDFFDLWDDNVEWNSNHLVSSILFFFCRLKKTKSLAVIYLSFCWVVGWVSSIDIWVCACGWIRKTRPRLGERERRLFTRLPICRRSSCASLFSFRCRYFIVVVVVVVLFFFARLFRLLLVSAGLIEKQLRNSFRGSTDIRCKTKLVRASKKKKNKKQKRNFQIDCQLMSDSTLVTNKTRQTRKHIINKNNNIL